MGTYIFSNPNNPSEVKEVFQHINDEHIYIENGIKWNRVFTCPTSSVDTKIDPFSSKEFAAKTSNKSGTLGDMYDRAKEASQQREKILGHDPIKEAHEKRYSDKRGGRKRPKKISDVVINV